MEQTPQSEFFYQRGKNCTPAQARPHLESRICFLSRSDPKRKKGACPTLHDPFWSREVSLQTEPTGPLIQAGSLLSTLRTVPRVE